MASLLDNASKKLIDARNDKNNPKVKTLPKYSSGARSLIRVGGKPLGVALDFKWNIQVQTTEIRTIDTNLPWDLVPGQIQITGTLNQILDPTQSIEQYGIFSTAQAMVHQPYVELQVLDALGISIFFAKGMFTSVNGSVSKGQLTNISANFQGVIWQHNVFQDFTPYSKLGDALEILNLGKKALSKYSGGFL